MKRAADTEREPGVSLRGVSLALGNQVVFDDFSLDLDAQKCTCILGPSGCGKSTLLKLIAGTFGLSFRGTVELAPALARRAKGGAGRGAACAWMGQEDLLLPWLSVLDNVLLGARLRGEARHEKEPAARNLLAEVGLGDSLKALPRSLSGGMRQRVALARTLMEDRPLMLMDEPFSALDALSRQRMQDISARLTRKKTVFLVTHDPLEALRLGDSIVVLGDSPLRVTYRLEPEETPPRVVGQGNFSALYQELLQILLASDQTSDQATGQASELATGQSSDLAFGREKT